MDCQSVIHTATERGRYTNILVPRRKLGRREDTQNLEDNTCPTLILPEFASDRFRLTTFSYLLCPTPMVRKLEQSSDSHGRFLKVQNAGLHPQSL